MTFSDIPFDFQIAASPWRFDFSRGKPADLSLINADRFFPEDVSRILISREAYASGMFRTPRPDPKGLKDRIFPSPGERSYV